MSDLDFLIKAANFEGGPNATHSAVAREVVDLFAEHAKAVLEMKLKITRERLRLMDATSLAKDAHEAGAALE